VNNAFAGVFMLAYIWVAIGGALGSAARFWFSDVISGMAERQGSIFPWGTLLVNVSGSFLIGFLFALSEPGGRRFIGSGGRQFFMYGVCGGYTTFSSFSLQTLNLLHDREWFYAGGNIVLSVVMCMIAVWLGYICGAGLNSIKGS
jgi:fluoride exporter